MRKITILGAGIAGISAAYYAKELNIESELFEARTSYGGLCDNFTINGFRFDYAVHLSFTQNEYVRSIFDQVNFLTHKPEAYNYSKGNWLKHPVQNNLFPLAVEEKILVIQDFINRPKEVRQENYEEWLISQYGHSFANQYPIPYTKKYWTLDADQLSTDWIGNRMYKPSVNEVLFGAMTDETPNTYYAKEMRYPKQGGYKSFIEGMAKECKINLNRKVMQIDPKEKYIVFQDGVKTHYEELLSTIPLPELIQMIDGVPSIIKEVAEELIATSVALVSVGFNRPDAAKHLWFYIYDEDIQAARVYSPSLKSPDNVPEGCSSLQFEIYYSKDKQMQMNNDELIQGVIRSIEKMDIAKREDIAVVDCRFVPYANVIFTHGMIEKRKIVRDYLKSIGIYTAGRFGEWDYLWSDQSLLSGKEVIEKMNGM